MNLRHLLLLVVLSDTFAADDRGGSKAFLAGYVAQNQLIAVMQALPVDCALSPRGDLVIATHSGLPDWGSGPQGMGRLFKLTYVAPDVPQPVLAYAISPTETLVEFDRPFASTQWKNLANQSSLQGGRYVSVGERYEKIRPGYAVVQAQLAESRRAYAIVGAGLSADARTLTLRSVPRAEAAAYALSLPGTLRAGGGTTPKALPQDAAIELTLETRADATPSLDLHWFTGEDSRPRALPLRRILTPWARPLGAAPEPKIDPELAAGNWESGRKLYFGAAACFTCHNIRGEGKPVGPDLGNLVYRDYASVLKDVMRPSATINPDYLGYVVELADSTSRTGIISGDATVEVQITDLAGATERLPRTRVRSIKPMETSLMPEGLLQSLKPDEVRDLMTFLLIERLAP